MLLFLLLLVAEGRFAIERLKLAATAGYDSPWNVVAEGRFAIERLKLDAAQLFRKASTVAEGPFAIGRLKLVSIAFFKKT